MLLGGVEDGDSLLSGAPQARRDGQAGGTAADDQDPMVLVECAHALLPVSWGPRRARPAMRVVIKCPDTGSARQLIMYVQ